MLTTESNFNSAKSMVQILTYSYLFYKFVTLGFAVSLLCRKTYQKIASTKWNWNFIEISKLTLVNTFMGPKFIKPVTETFYQIGGINNVITALGKFKESTLALKKIPSHVGIIIPPKEFHSKTNVNEITKAVSKEISWLYLAGVNTITIYDVRGKLKTLSEDISEQVYHEIRQNNQLLREVNNNTKENQDASFLRPKIQVIVDKKCQGFLASDHAALAPEKSLLNIYVRSYLDGKPGYINAIKQTLVTENANIKTDTERKIKNPANIFGYEIKIDQLDETAKLALNSKYVMRDGKIPNENKLNMILNNYLYKAKCTFEPDMLIIHGNIYSTFGFLPWHIRLAEFYWTGIALSKFKLNHLNQLLVKFSQVNQKLGK